MRTGTGWRTSEKRRTRSGGRVGYKRGEKAARGWRRGYGRGWEETDRGHDPGAMEIGCRTRRDRGRDV